MECYLSPANASSSHTQCSTLTQAGSSLETYIKKSSFKNPVKADYLVLLQCPGKPLPYILQQTSKTDYFFSGRKCLFSCHFLLDQHLYASLLIVNIDLKLCGAGPLLFFRVTNHPCHYKGTTILWLFSRCISLTSSPMHTFLNKSTRTSSQNTTFLQWKLVKDVIM